VPIGTRVSRAGSKVAGFAVAPRPVAGSFQGLVILPSPLVSITAGHQPCDACSSLVASYFLVSIHPNASRSPLK
jgi:hypothetical protein